MSGQSVTNTGSPKYPGTFTVKRPRKKNVWHFRCPNTVFNLTPIHHPSPMWKSSFLHGRCFCWKRRLAFGAEDFWDAASFLGRSGTNNLTFLNERLNKDASGDMRGRRGGWGGEAEHSGRHECDVFHLLRSNCAIILTVYMAAQRFQPQKHSFSLEAHHWNAFRTSTTVLLIILPFGPGIKMHRGKFDRKKPMLMREKEI